MIRAGSYKGKAQRDIHPLVEGDELERDKALVVVHAEHGIKLPLRGTPKNRVRAKRPRERTLGIRSRQQGKCRGDDLLFLIAEITLFPGMGIEPGNGNPGCWDSAPQEMIRE
jgi:hypothetical protein